MAKIDILSHEWDSKNTEELVEALETKLAQAALINSGEWLKTEEHLVLADG